MTAIATAVADTASAGATVVAYARAALGVPYVYATPRPITTGLAHSYDCSGLAACAWLTVGQKIVPYTVTMYAQTQHRLLTAAQPGDLIYYRDRSGYIYHVAICIGGGQLIEAPEPGKSVQQRAYSVSDADIMPTVSALPAGATEGSSSAGSTSSPGSSGGSVGIAADALQLPGLGQVGTATSWLLGGWVTPATKLVQTLTDLSNWRRAGLWAAGLALLAVAIWVTIGAPLPPAAALARKVIEK